MSLTVWRIIVVLTISSPFLSPTASKTPTITNSGITSPTTVAHSIAKASNTAVTSTIRSTKGSKPTATSSTKITPTTIKISTSISMSHSKTTPAATTSNPSKKTANTTAGRNGASTFEPTKQQTAATVRTSDPFPLWIILIYVAAGIMLVAVLASCAGAACWMRKQDRKVVAVTNARMLEEAPHAAPISVGQKEGPLPLEDEPRAVVVVAKKAVLVLQEDKTQDPLSPQFVQENTQRSSLYSDADKDEEEYTQGSPSDANVRDAVTVQQTDTNTPQMETVIVHETPPSVDGTTALASTNTKTMTTAGGATSSDEEPSSEDSD